MKITKSFAPMTLEIETEEDLNFLLKLAFFSRDSLEVCGLKSFFNSNDAELLKDIEHFIRKLQK